MTHAREYGLIWRKFEQKTMSQDQMIKLISEGDENGVGKGHVIYSRKNKKKIKTRLELKKHNPIAKTHTLYKESK